MGYVELFLLSLFIFMGGATRVKVQEEEEDANYSRTRTAFIMLFSYSFQRWLGEHLTSNKTNGKAFLGGDTEIPAFVSWRA